MFHPGHRLFSRLKNYSTVSVTISLGDWVFFGVYLEQFNYSRADKPNQTKKQKQGVAETASDLQILWSTMDCHV